MKCYYHYAGKLVELRCDEENIIIPEGTPIPEWTGTYLGADNEPKYFTDMRAVEVKNGVAVSDIYFDLDKPSAAGSFLYGKTAPRRAIVFDEDDIDEVECDNEFQQFFGEPIKGIVHAIELQIEANNEIIRENNARLEENNANLKILRKVFQSCNL